MKQYVNGRRTHLANVYHNMKSRCDNPNSNIYKWYGARGIKVCPEWARFDAFAKWAMANGYNENLTIDRIDNDGDYCPENCRWSTLRDNCNNRHNNHRIVHDNETRTMQQWADQKNMNVVTLSGRLAKGWSAERAINEPVHTKFGRHPITWNGETRSLAEWARIYGMSDTTLSRRLNQLGWSIEKALTTPVAKRGR